MSVFRRRLMSASGKEEEDPMEALYLTFEALEDGFQITKSGQDQPQYSIDGGVTWRSVHYSNKTVAINKGQKMYLRGNLTPKNTYGIGSFKANKKFRAKGNCMSLLFGDNAKDAYSLDGYDYAFLKLFDNCATLEDVSGLKLQALVLSNACYEKMFEDCTSLINAPVLPAMSLSRRCYYEMFIRCKSLKEAPKLPATTLAAYCYYGMFSVCSSLKSAPQLPAIDLITDCYGGMFKECASLVNPPLLPAQTLQARCYSNMFYGCTSLVKAPDLPAESLKTNCYYAMFFSCSNLNYIKAMFLETSASYTGSWVTGVASSGTFVKNKNATWNNVGDDGVPEGWDVVLE